MMAFRELYIRNKWPAATLAPSARRSRAHQTGLIRIVHASCKLQRLLLHRVQKSRWHSFADANGLRASPCRWQTFFVTTTQLLPTPARYQSGRELVKSVRLRPLLPGGAPIVCSVRMSRILQELPGRPLRKGGTQLRILAGQAFCTARCLFRFWEGLHQPRWRVKQTGVEHAYECCKHGERGLRSDQVANAPRSPHRRHCQQHC